MLGALTAALLASCAAAQAAQSNSFLDGIHRQATLTSTVPENGDQNPYAIVVAPVSAGAVQKDDVLVTNFNSSGNLQGLGARSSTITPRQESFRPSPRCRADLAQCPGGVGLTTAMTMLKTGWVIVGSAPSADGTTKTKGAGCLIVLDSTGKVVSMSSPANDQHALGQHGDDRQRRNGDACSSATPASASVRLKASRRSSTRRPCCASNCRSPSGKPPAVVSQTVIGSGFGAQADKDVLPDRPDRPRARRGRHALCLRRDRQPHRRDPRRSDTRPTVPAPARTVTKDGLLQRPLAMATAPNGHLLVTNGLNGQVVEVDPASGQQIYARWIDPNKAQKPPGSGDLFGIAMTPAGDGFYYVEDEVNTLVLAR